MKLLHRSKKSFSSRTFLSVQLLPQHLSQSQPAQHDDPKAHTLNSCSPSPIARAVFSFFPQWCWHLESFVSHVSHSLKWPCTAYGQQSALFWAIVRNIKKQFAGRPIEQTCNRSPNITSMVDCYCHWMVGGSTSDSRLLGNFRLYWAGLHKRQMEVSLTQALQWWCRYTKIHQINRS